MVRKGVLVNLKKYGFKVDNRYRKDWAKSGKVLIRGDVLGALIKARKFLPEGYNFEVYDGKRSVEDQRRIIKICEDDFKKRYPGSWEKRLVTFTGGYDSLKMKLPMDTHRQGGAVDLTIVDGKGKRLDMGGRKFNESSRLDYYEKKVLNSKEKVIGDNRRLLKRAMEKAGFKGNVDEWHHWGFGG